MSKKGVFGYRIIDRKTKEVVDELIGHYPQKFLNKYKSNKDLMVKKITMPKVVA